MMDELITNYAVNAGFENVKVDYTMSTKASDENRAASMNGTYVMVALLLAILGFSAFCTLFELFPWGDMEEYRSSDKADLLKEASKFRRLT